VHDLRFLQQMLCQCIVGLSYSVFADFQYCIVKTVKYQFSYLIYTKQLVCIRSTSNNVLLYETTGYRP